MVAEQHPRHRSPLAWRHDRLGDVDAIKTALAVASVAEDPALSEITGHLVGAGPNRIRPEFVVASGLVGVDERTIHNAADPKLIKAAVAVELVHVGSLHHDDVIAGAATRYGIETVNERWGNLKAILAGDFLLARASELAAALGTDIAKLLAETIAWCCEGQARNLQSLNNVDRSEEEYFDAISGRTAALFGTACRIGGLVGELEAGVLDRLTDFGRSYGMAFQIIEDIADITGAAANVKPVGSDIASGVYTLPVIRRLANEPDSELRHLLGDPITVADAAHRRALELLRSNSVLTSCMDTARAHVDAASRLIADIDGGPALNGLISAAQDLVAG